MFTYYQRTGRLYDDSHLLAFGYAGQGAGKNNPDRQEVACEGPLPRGQYTIGEAYLDPHRGPLTMRLTPAPENQMFGRSGFLIHADSTQHPGAASEGCIVLPLAARMVVAWAADRQLRVVA